MSSNKDISSFGYTQELKRSLTLRDLIVYGLIFMVPIAPFGIYGYVVSDSKGMVALTYIIGMFSMVFTALSYAQLSKAFPIAGSVYSYAQRGINPAVGFIAGWLVLLDYILVPALLYIVAANALLSLAPDVPSWAWILLFIVINTAINVRGIELAAKANLIILVLELIVLAVFLVLGFIAISNGAGEGFTTKPVYNAQEFSIPFVMSAVSIAVLSFLGFDGISTLAEETKGGNDVVGKASLWALLIVGVLFISQTWIAALIWPDYTSFTNLDIAFYEVAGIAGGMTLKNVCIIATVISWGVANALAAQSAISRILYSMGRDRNLPGFLALVHPKFKTPYLSTLLVGGISIVIGLVFLNDTSALASLVNFGAMCSFLLLHLAVINYFFIKGKSKHYFPHLILPGIGFIIIAYVIYNFSDSSKVLGSVWFVIGAVYYAILRKSKKDIKFDNI